MAKEHFIPFRKSDIVAMCLRDSDFDAQQQEDFAHCCSLLQSIFHFEFHQSLEQLKDRYAPVTRTPRRWTAGWSTGSRPNGAANSIFTAPMLWRNSDALACQGHRMEPGR